MKRNMKRDLSILLILCTLLAALFSSCKGPAEKTDETPERRTEEKAERVSGSQDERTADDAADGAGLTASDGNAQAAPVGKSEETNEGSNEGMNKETGEGGIDAMANEVIAPGVYCRTLRDDSHENTWLVLKESGVWYLYGLGSDTAVPHGKYAVDGGRLVCGALVFEQSGKNTLRLISCGDGFTGENPIEPGTKYVRSEGSGDDGVFRVTVDPGETDCSAWTTYICERTGCAGIFSISLCGNGFCSYYEGMLSSHLGFAEWTLEDGILTIKEEKSVMNDDRKSCEMKEFCYRFAVSDDKLTFLADASDANRFCYVRLKDGETFFRV